MTEIKVGNTVVPLVEGDDILKSLMNGTYRIKTVIYGPSGCGKTRMAATFPYRCGVVDMDEGAMVYTGNHQIATVIPDVKKPGGQASAYRTADGVIDHFIKDDDIKGIVIDSCTTLGDCCMNHVQALAGHFALAPTQPERNSALELMKNLFTKLRACGKHLIIIAHEKWEQDQISGRMWCRPAVAGQYSAAMPVYFSEVYHGEIKKTATGIKYTFTTKSDSIYTCKSRMDSIVPIGETIEPDFKPIVAAIERKIASLNN